MMESHSRMLERNLFPMPSPLLAPLTRPAISRISMAVGTICSELEIRLITCHRTSTVTKVQNAQMQTIVLHTCRVRCVMDCMGLLCRMRYRLQA